jgi:hypothetical protein
VLRSRTRHRGVNREKIFRVFEPENKIFRADERSAKDFAGTTARAMPHAVRSMQHVNFTVCVSTL